MNVHKKLAGGWVKWFILITPLMDSMGVQMCFRSKLPFFSPMVGRVINPILGSYIPTIRIPTKGGMTIPNMGSLDSGHKWRWTFFQRFFGWCQRGSSVFVAWTHRVPLRYKSTMERMSGVAERLRLGGTLKGATIFLGDLQTLWFHGKHWGGVS